MAAAERERRRLVHFVPRDMSMNRLALASGLRFAARAEREQQRFEAKAKTRMPTEVTAAGLGLGETAHLQAVVKTAGRQWWRTKVRVVAQDVPSPPRAKRGMPARQDAGGS